ncbi:MAG: hypothetical protein ACJAYU_005340, partial [Bradymonadia bacterium]
MAGASCSTSPEEDPDAPETDVETDVSADLVEEDVSGLGEEDVDDGADLVEQDVSDLDGGDDTSTDIAPPDVPISPSDFYVGAGVDLETLGRNGQALTDLNLAPLTHFSIGYAHVSETGICTLTEASAIAIGQLIEAGPTPRLLLAVGGYTNSENFSSVSADPTARALFASSCAALVDEHGFDGLEVNWSQPVLGAFPDFDGEVDDWANYQLLLETTRGELDAVG